MEVYAVLIVLGTIVASVGPWPADLDNCKSNIPASNRDMDAAFNDPVKLAKFHEVWPGLTRKDANWTCIESATKPEIKDAVRVH